MHTSTRHTKKSHPIKHLNGRSHKKLTKLTSQLENMYSSSVKKVKRKPYQAAAILISLGVISSLYYFYRTIK
jgi:hypothetical protein